MPVPSHCRQSSTLIPITGERQIDGAAHPAVHVAPVTDRHRRPGARHGAARGHRVDERDARPPVERDQLAAGRVDRGDPQHAVRPLMRRQSPGDHLTSHRLGHRGCRQCGLANPLQLLSGRRVGLGHGGHEQVGDVVDVDAGIDLRRRGGHLPVKQRVQADSAAQLGGHGRAGRRAQQHVGIQQCLRRVHRFVGYASQNADLPSDARKPSTGENQCAFLWHGHPVCQCHACHGTVCVSERGVRLAKTEGRQWFWMPRRAVSNTAS